MLPQRERLVQLARLAGQERFVERFGSSQTAKPDLDALRPFVDEHLDAIANGLVSEAAASDDVTDQASAQSYLQDRLETLSDLFTPDQALRIRSQFNERTSSW